MTTLMLDASCHLHRFLSNPGFCIFKLCERICGPSVCLGRSSLCLLESRLRLETSYFDQLADEICKFAFVENAVSGPPAEVSGQRASRVFTCHIETAQLQSTNHMLSSKSSCTCLA